MKHHPYTDIWPMMEGRAYERFKADIAANGLLVPILTYKDMVIDGRNRELACEQVGVLVEYKDCGAASDEEALALIVSLNEHRRHMDKNQRAFAADKLANILNGHNYRKTKIQGISNEIPSVSTTVSSTAESEHQPISLVMAAVVMNTSVTRVRRARGIRKHGGEEAVNEVLSGKISLDAQYNKVTPKRGETDKKPKRPVGRPPSRLSRPAPIIKNLTREEIDPEFTGTAIEWVDKYGHVQLNKTAEIFAKERFDMWATNMKVIATEAKKLTYWPAVDLNWLRSPTPRAIARMTEALDILRGKMTEAENMLVKAVEAIKEKSVA